MSRLLRISLALVVAFLLVAPPASASWVWPLRGEVITPYRNGDDPYAAGQHRGIDIAGPVGAPVVAAAGGEVRFAGVAGSSGLTVSVRSADGFDISYLHLSATAVRAGDRISAGERLGAVGTTGTRSAAVPHLHFGVREAGTRDAYRDPLDFLPGSPAAPGEAPRAAPVPAPRSAPAPVAPVPETIPDARPVGRGAPASEPVRAPRRVPAPGRVPLGRPLPAPQGVRSPQTTQAPHGVPLRPEPAARQRPEGRTGPIQRHSSAPAGNAVRIPDLTPVAEGAGTGPQASEREPAPLDPEAEMRAAVGGRAGRGAVGVGHAPGAAQASSPAPGPDVGMVLACAGLLLAAALTGGTSQGREATVRGGRRLARVLRPVMGRG